MESNLVELVKDNGIVGAGGAGFPTHIKLSAKAEYVLVNGAECEPLLRVDQQLLEVYAKDILFVLNKVVKAVDAKKGIVALKKKYKAAIESLHKELVNYGCLEIFELDDFYPAGDEQVTVYEVLKRIVPEGGIPINVQTVVLNVETLLNIHNALEGMPVTEKYLTISGSVKTPVTVKVPIGITITEAIDLAGGATVENFAVIDGGPMMGKLLDGVKGNIKKNTKGLIVLPKDHPLIIAKVKGIEKMLKEARAACCHCSLCTEVCPRNLLGHKLSPDKLMRVASYGNTCETDTKLSEAFLCCECGLCEQACIMGLQPWKLNKFLKLKLSSSGIKNTNNRRPDQVSQFREYRKFPVKKLIGRLGLEKYNVMAPLQNVDEKKFDKVTIELRQHIGASSEPVVSLGTTVVKNQLIADIPEGKMGARVHASIDGEVITINENFIIIKR